MVERSGQGKENGVHALAQQERSASREEEEQAAGAEECAPRQVSQGTGIPPLTRTERRTLWIKEYGEQGLALYKWRPLVEQQDLEIEVYCFHRRLSEAS
jgi:hypothetical protein